MNKKTWTAAALLIAFTSYAADTIIQNDKIRLGKRTSSADKVLEADVNQGAANPKLRVTPGTNRWQYTNDGTTWKDIGSGGGGGLGINLLTNGDFESGLGSWTASGGTFTTVNSGANFTGSGLASGSWAPSANSQTLTSNQYTLQAGLYGKQCMAKVYYKSAETAYPYTLSAIDGSSNVLGSTTLAATNGIFQNGYVTFLCPSSGTLALRVTAGSTVPSNTLYLDDAVLGTNTLFANVSQATLMGTVKVTGCAAAWSSTSVSFADYPVATGCVYTTTGAAIAPATNLPAIKFASLPPGEYLISAEGSMGPSTTSWAQYQFWDGTNTAREISDSGTSGGSTGQMYYGSVNQSLAYTAAQSNVTLSLRALTNGTSYLYGTTANPLVIRVYRYPTQADTVFRPDMTPASWSGYQTVTSGWTDTSTNWGDPSAGTGVALTEISNRNFGTVANAASGLAGITFTPPRVGRYHVCATGTLINSGGAMTAVTRIADGSGNPITGGHDLFMGTASSNSAFPTQCGIYNVASVSPVTVKIQLASNTGTALSITNGAPSAAALDWSIVELDAPMPAPILQGSLLSSSAGVERMDRATIASTCTTSPCTINRTSGNFSTVTRSAAGTYVANFTTAYSVAPSCWANFNNGSSALTACNPREGTITTSSVEVDCMNSSTGALTDASFNIICVGPR